MSVKNRKLDNLKRTQLLWNQNREGRTVSAKPSTNYAAPLRENENKWQLKLLFV